MAFDAYPELARHVLDRRHRARPALLGISGGVSVGKTTTAELVQRHIRDQGAEADILCTDAFLLDNDELARRGLLLRKGFPESYDVGLLVSVLARLRRGDVPVRVPVYSHETYDRLPGVEQEVGAADVVIIEGVNVLQPEVVEQLDVSVYVDAEEEHMAEWFRDRFLTLCESAGEGTFYSGFAAMSAEERAAMAITAWDAINAVNLREHILPSRERATFVLRKAADHSPVGLVTARS